MIIELLEVLQNFTVRSSNQSGARRRPPSLGMGPFDLILTCQTLDPLSHLFGPSNTLDLCLSRAINTLSLKRKGSDESPPPMPPTKLLKGVPSYQKNKLDWVPSPPSFPKTPVLRAHYSGSNKRLAKTPSRGRISKSRYQSCLVDIKIHEVVEGNVCSNPLLVNVSPISLGLDGQLSLPTMSVSDSCLSEVVVVAGPIQPPQPC